MAEKVTWLKLTAKLDSDKNLNKVKKALCSIPQIRDQTFDDENNTVTIKVVSCSPEKIMNKLCSKGRGAITRIDTIDPPKPKEPEKPEEKEEPKPVPSGDPNSQPVTMMQAYDPALMMGQSMYNNRPYGLSYGEPIQQLWYPSRPVYDSWGGGGPPPPPPPYSNNYHHYFNDENTDGCYIM